MFFYYFIIFQSIDENSYEEAKMQLSMLFIYSNVTCLMHVNVTTDIFAHFKIR